MYDRERRGQRKTVEDKYRGMMMKEAGRKKKRRRMWASRDRKCAEREKINRKIDVLWLE